MAELLTSTETAERLRIGETVLRRLRRQGLISYVAVTDRKIMYRAEDVDACDVSSKFSRRRALHENYPKGAVVYFIQVEETGPIKIGFTTDLSKRIDRLQTANPFDLRLLLAIDGTFQEEQNLHSELSEYRLRGEWFLPAPEVLDLIEKIRTLL